MEADKTLHIAQNGTVVPRVIMDSASRPHQVMVCTLIWAESAEHPWRAKADVSRTWGAYGATADMSAKIGGEGDLASIRCDRFRFPTVRTTIRGQLRSDGDITYRCGWRAGQHPGLNISNAAIVDLNGSTQTVETSPGRWVRLFCSKKGR